MSPRREYMLRVRCPADGCTDVRYYSYPTQREYRDGVQRYRDPQLARCVRHTRPDDVLSADNYARETTLVAKDLHRDVLGERRYIGRFWYRLTGSETASSGSGFEYGPGFKAFAQDFPEGTRLYVRAEVELPEDAVLGAEAAEHDITPKGAGQ